MGGWDDGVFVGTQWKALMGIDEDGIATSGGETYFEKMHLRLGISCVISDKILHLSHDSGGGGYENVLATQ